MVHHSSIERPVSQDVFVQYVLSALRPLIIQFDMINVQRRFCRDLWPGYCRGSPLRQTPKSLSPSLVHLPGLLSLFLIS